MAQNYFKPNRQQIIFQGILAIIAGALLFIYPNSPELIIRFIGFLLLSMLLFNLITAYMNKKKYTDNPMLTIGGAILLIGGSLLLLFPTMFVKIFLIFIGLVLFFAGLSQILVAIQFRLFKGFSWVNLIIGVGILAGGVYVITRPKEAANDLTKLIGFFIMLHGFSELFLASRIKHLQKNREGNVEDVKYEELD